MEKFDTEGLTAGEKAELRKISEETLRSWVVDRVKPLFEPSAGALLEHRGAFVTLRKGGDLRGCIGIVEGIRPLWETVRDMTVSASTQDPRFSPLRPDELPLTSTEISALSPLFRIKDIEGLRAGVHGLMVRREGRCGLLLPQVALEQDWDIPNLAEHACMKAWLPPDAWKEAGTELWAFTADIF